MWLKQTCRIGHFGFDYAQTEKSHKIYLISQLLIQTEVRLHVEQNEKKI